MLLSAICGWAQTKDSIDISHLLTVYNYQCQTTDAEGNPVTDQMKLALQVGTHCTRSYPYWKYQDDNEGMDHLSNGTMLQVRYDESYTFMPEIWTNYPDDRQTIRDAILPKIYEANEPRISPKWTLTDDTLTVCDYSCKSATTFLHGRQWTAYYTEEIPSSAGPWKLCGLPGLILRAEDESRTHSFIAEIIKSDGAPIFYEHNAITIKISEKKLIKQKSLTFGNRLYAKNPTYYIDIRNMAKTEDNVGATITGGKYVNIVNGIIEKDKAHVYQPLELK